MSLLRASVGSLLLLLTFVSLAGAPAPRGLEFIWIDSEGGGSTLMLTPAGEAVLFDTGNPGGRDPGRIVAAARAAGVSRLDHVVITHWHTDHYGGAAEVAQQLPIDRLHHRALPDQDPDGRKQSTFPVQIRPFREIDAPRSPLAPGTVLPLRQDPAGARLVVRCLAADQRFVEPTAEQRRTTNPLAGTVPAKPTDTSDNANSTVFLIEYGPFRFFHGGDLTWNLEERLVVPHNLVGTVDVYQTNHHGLEVSNHPVLVRTLAPTVVVMNNGPKKGGQPGAFAAIRATASVQALYQVHRSFNVPDGENAPAEHIANHENLTGADAARCPAHGVKLAVAPDGRSYTVAVPSTGHARTFQTRSH